MLTDRTSKAVLACIAIRVMDSRGRNSISASSIQGKRRDVCGDFHFLFSVSAK